MRCSQVTILRSRLFRTTIIMFGVFQDCQYLLMVNNSSFPFICIAPSPAIAMTVFSEWANFAAIAYGTAQPMVARFPESDAIMPVRIFNSLAYQLAPDPESAVSMQL